MIQFNLLPDVKLEYIKANRTKRLVLGTAFAVTITTLTVFVLLLAVVQGVQKKNLRDLDGDIKTYTAELKETPDLNKILTIQNQLAALNGLHDQKPLASRIFPIIQKVTPTDVTLDDVTVDFALNTITIGGAAPSLDKVNIFADTMKFVTYQDSQGQTQKAFSEVVLSQFSRSDKGATFILNFKYAPPLFSSAETADLNVPDTITTRSIVEQPTDIFKENEKN